jgi:hypothetical protein
MILCIVTIVTFVFKKRMVGVIIGKASSSRSRYFYLILALFMLCLEFERVYIAVYIQGNMSSSSIYGMALNLLVASCYLTMFFSSQIHIGLKGVAIPTVPFFIPRDQIIDYEVLSNALVLRRKGKADYRTVLEINDVKNIEAAIRQLQND